jgi:hypothetical protein
MESDLNSWHGVTAHANGDVTRIELKQNFLAGKLGFLLHKWIGILPVKL